LAFYNAMGILEGAVSRKLS